jgi:hypothetical protein
MARYVYEGQAPEQVQENGLLRLVRPGDELEFGDPPAWGAWRPLDEPEAAPPAPPPPPPAAATVPAATVPSPES